MKRCTAGNHDAAERDVVTIGNGATMCRECAALVVQIVDERPADWTETTAAVNAQVYNSTVAPPYPVASARTTTPVPTLDLVDPQTRNPTPWILR